MMAVNPAAAVLTQPFYRSQKPAWLLKLFYIFSALFVVSVLAFNIFKPIKVLPRVSLAPGFVFTTQNGVRKTSEDFRGKLTIYSFTYAQCGNGCAQTMSQMQSLREMLAHSGQQDIKFALVTISIDPKHDTSDVLNAYAAPFLANQTNSIPWDFLTGDVLLTKYVVGGGFNVYYQDAINQAGESSIKFEPRYILVDGWGIIRSEYRGADLDVQAVMRDIGYLESEVRNSQGPARYAYEAAHLFRCYP